MVYVFNRDGQCLERNTNPVAPERPAFEANHGPDLTLVPVDDDPAPDAPLEFITLVDGQVAVDPTWQPPAPPAPVDLAAKIEALEAVVAGNLLASPHDRRWLQQKEAAKAFGIPWLKANPEAGQAQCEAAVQAHLESAFPGLPVVVSGGVLLSYAAEAAARGYIPEASFEALRALVLAASDSQLNSMLKAL